MPEGDTIYRTATVLRRVLLGHCLTGFETTVRQVATANARQPMVGRVVHDIATRGKHLLILFRDRDAGPAADLVLHTHLGMTGSWHVYHLGAPWKKPERFAKAVLRTAAAVVPCFSAPIVELLTPHEIAHHPALARLGPDAIADAFDAGEVRTRFRGRPDLSIGEGLLLQAAMAGVGNVFKSEVLFLERVNPFLRIGDLSDETLGRLVAQSRRLLLLNRRPGSRRTRARLDPQGRIWVYRRSGRPCYRCGTAIRMRRQGADARSTYFCPRCQGVAQAATRTPDTWAEGVRAWVAAGPGGADVPASRTPPTGDGEAP
jgi:endonuclease VIII